MDETGPKGTETIGVIPIGLPGSRGRVEMLFYVVCRQRPTTYWTGRDMNM